RPGCGERRSRTTGRPARRARAAHICELTSGKDSARLRVALSGEQGRLQGGQLRQVLGTIGCTLARDDAIEAQRAERDTVHVTGDRPLVLDRKRIEAVSGENDIDAIQAGSAE